MSTLTLKRTRPEVSKPFAQPASPPLSAEVFWFIWSPTEQRPKRRHPTITSARIEALRLRTVAPDKEFFIYRAERITAVDP